MSVPDQMNTLTDADEEAVRHLIASAERYQNDASRFIELHHPDVVIVNVAGRRVLGRAALQRAAVAALDGSLADVVTRLEVQDIRFLRRDVALVSCVKHISDQRGATPDGASENLPSTGSTTFVVLREHDTWKIAAAQTTPIRG